MRLSFSVRGGVVGLVALTVVGLAGASVWQPPRVAHLARMNAERRERGPDQPDEALRWRQIFERDEKGVIDPNGLINAANQMRRMRAQQIGTYPPGGEPPPIAGITNGGWTSVGPGNIGGRTRGIAIHPTTPTTMFAGGVAGGIWRTTNGGASWAPIDDFMANLAVSSIVYRPGDPMTMFAGTGEGFFNFDQIRGAGIFRSIDGGTTWTQLAATANSSFFFVNRLAMSADGSILLAATGVGIFQSTDLGVTWGPPKLAAPAIADVKFIPGSSTMAVASGYQKNAYYSSNGGATWTLATSGLNSVGTLNFGRVELGVSASNPGVIFASYDSANDTNPPVANAQFYRSDNFGVDYALVSSPTHLGGQGWYDNVVWVDPTNLNNIVVGGIDLWRSTNAGVNWTKISSWQSAPVSAHADHHIIVHHPGYNGTTNRIVYFGNDGGVYRADDVLAAVAGPGIPFQELNNNYQVTQFYGGDGLNDGRLYGGTQDNGTILYSPGGGSENWTTIAGGDGGFASADRINNFLYGEYQWLQVHRSNNGALSATIHACGSAAPLNDTCIQSTNFIAPLVVDPSSADRLYAGGTSLWRTGNPRSSPASTVAWASIKASIGSPISAIAIAPTNPDVIWVGHNNGDVYRTTNGLVAAPVWTRRDNTAPTLPNRAVASIAVDPSDPNRVYVSFGGFSSDNLWVTTDGGANWADASGSGGGDLPAAPVRWVATHPTQAGWLYAATDVGVFASENGGTSWTVPHDGPANVAVFQLFWVGNTLVAATHGRGMFTALVVPSNTPPSINSHPASQTIGVGQTAMLSVGASGSAPLSFQWYNGTSPNTASPIGGATSSTYTTPPLAATANYWVRVTNAFGFADSNTATITVVAFATFDPTLQAPMCATVGNICDSGPTLLNGSDTMMGGAEPNQPNTIMDSCSDGTAGVYHTDESNDRLRVFTLDGTPFAPGKTVQVDATVWAYTDFVSDALDLYYAANAAAPVWTPIATSVVPAAGGQQVISSTFVLPAGTLQAVRARFRYLGSAGTCTGGTAHFDDHDDLIFAVGPGGGTELILNGDFSGGMASWSTFDNPAGVGTFNVVGGVMQFSRSQPPTGFNNQATVFQQTGQPLAANTPLTATFQVGNTGPNRRYMKVLMVGDPLFGDLAACTLWLEAGQPLTTYSMKGHTTQAVPNIALYFYASSHSGTGGSYLLDNVSMQVTPGDSTERIACFDPNAPAPPGGAVGPDLITDGSFTSGALALNWFVQGPVTWQINPTGNVLEFIRTASPNPPVVPPAVILQSTGQVMANDQILTATFMLGNSSLVRKRVLILVHDLNFLDLVACTWWLNPGQTLSRYVMKFYASAEWTNGAAIAIYPSTTGPDQWMRIDDITLQRTPGATTVGSECLEGSLAVGPEPNLPGTRRGLSEPAAQLPESPDALPAGNPTPTRGRTRGRRLRSRG